MTPPLVAPPRRLARYLLLLCAGLSLLVSLPGCHGSEEFGGIVGSTDLPVGYSVALQTQTTEVNWFPVAATHVDAAHTFRFDRLTPGEYRLVAFNASNQPVFANLSFGVGVSQTVVVFNIPSELLNPL